MNDFAAIVAWVNGDKTLSPEARVWIAELLAKIAELEARIAALEP